MKAYKGERVTCENGHEVFEFTEDVFLDNTIRSEQVSPLQEGLFFDHARMDHVCECGAFFAKDIGGIRFHFEDGYR